MEEWRDGEMEEWELFWRRSVIVAQEACLFERDKRR